MTRNKAECSWFLALVLLVTLVASPATTRGGPMYSGALDVQLQVSGITSITGPLNYIPSYLIIEAQTSGTTSTSMTGNATASVTGSQDVISSGIPVGDGPSPILALGDGFTLNSLVTGSAGLPGGIATSTAARAGAISFRYPDVAFGGGLTFNILIDTTFDLLAPSSGLGVSSTESTGFSVRTFRGANLFDTFTQSAPSPAGGFMGSRQLSFQFSLSPGEEFGIGVDAGIGGTVAVPEPSSIASAVIGIITVLGYGTWRRRAGGRGKADGMPRPPADGRACPCG